MNIYEKVAFAANIILIAIVLARLLEVWAISIPIMLILVIILLHKINSDNKFREIEELEDKRKKTIDTALVSIDELSERIIEAKVELRKEILEAENRMASQKTDLEAVAEKSYRELVGRIVMMENRLNQAKKNLASYIWYLEKKMEMRREGL
jgi:hypothetical protein